MLSMSFGGFDLQTSHSPGKCLNIMMATPTLDIDQLMADVIYYNAHEYNSRNHGGRTLFTGKYLPRLSKIIPENKFQYDYNIIRLVSYRGSILNTGDGGSVISVIYELKLLNLILFWIINLGVLAVFIRLLNITLVTNLDLYCFNLLISITFTRLC